jgi:hypothetical protein
MRCDQKSCYGQCRYEQGHDGPHCAEQVMAGNVMGGTFAALTATFGTSMASPRREGPTCVGCGNTTEERHQSARGAYWRCAGCGLPCGTLTKIG